MDPRAGDAPPRGRTSAPSSARRSSVLAGDRADLLMPYTRDFARRAAEAVGRVRVRRRGSTRRRTLYAPLGALLERHDVLLCPTVACPRARRRRRLPRPTVPVGDVQLPLDRRHHDPAVQRHRPGAGARRAVADARPPACPPVCSSSGARTTTPPSSGAGARTRGGPRAVGPTRPGGRRCEPGRAVMWFVVRRLLGMVVTLFVTSFLVFASLYVAPGDPIELPAAGTQPLAGGGGRGHGAVRPGPAVPRAVPALARRRAARRLRPVAAVPRGRGFAHRVPAADDAWPWWACRPLLILVVGLARRHRRRAAGRTTARTRQSSSLVHGACCDPVLRRGDPADLGASRCGWAGSRPSAPARASATSSTTCTLPAIALSLTFIALVSAG